jgi:hypothetical protein
MQEQPDLYYLAAIIIGIAITKIALITWLR